MSTPSAIPIADRIESLRLRRDISKGYINQLRYAVGQFRDWLGREPTVGDLHADTVNRWIIELGERGLSKYSIHAYWRHLRVIWYDAFQEGLTDAHPSRVRKIKRPRLAHKAWTPEEVARVLAEADKLTGVSKKSRVPRAEFWRAFLLTLWDSGLRLGDMLLLKTADVRGRSDFVVVQHKTGWPTTVHLWPNTVAAIEATYPPERERVFGGYCRQKIFTGFRALVSAAGVRPGGCHMIRRSSATALEMACPGAATRHLGHLTPDMAMKHYLDHAQLDHAKPLPPPLPCKPKIAGLLPAPKEGGDDAH